MKYVWRLAFVTATLFVASSTFACNIPVFRYALENWQPDPYRIAVVHRGPLTDDQFQVFQNLQQQNSHPTKPANVVVFDIDLDGETDDGERREVPEDFERLVRYEFEKSELKQPTIALYFPDVNARSIWRSALTHANVDGVVDSPLRREVANRVLDGQSAVWVLVKSGDAAKDEAAEKTLAEKLALANEKVELPDQSLIEAEDEFRPDNPIELRVEFSMLTVDRDDPKEQPFVSMILNSEEDIADFDEPIAIPIFGRGRTYFALIGRGINEDNILDNCGFVCGACSCQVKQANPGIDTLMALDWSAKITGSAMPDVELPELTGIGDLVAATDDATDGVAKVSDADAKESANLPVTDSNVADHSNSDVTDRQAQALSPEQTAALKDQLDENVAKPMEKATLLVMVGGTVAAAAFVFVVSLFIRRAA